MRHSRQCVSPTLISGTVSQKLEIFYKKMVELCKHSSPATLSTIHRYTPFHCPRVFFLYNTQVHTLPFSTCVLFIQYTGTNPSIVHTYSFLGSAECEAVLRQYTGTHPSIVHTYSFLYNTQVHTLPLSRQLSGLINH
jgi:hypothetical protein